MTVTARHRPRPRSAHLRLARCCVIAMLTLVLSACAIAPPRTDDPLQPFNRRMFAFNQFADKAVMRPVAKGYVKITTPGMRDHIGDFFANLGTPITIVNEFLQGRPGPALDMFTRLLINTTVGVLGFFDPATRFGIPNHSTDFGVTLANWGVPQGPYLVLPLLGPTTVRDVWRYPADSYADPMVWYIREHQLRYHAEYAPEVLSFVNQRASLLPFDKLLDSAFDPYAFVRDAYLQHRVNMIYHGNPPLSVILQMEGSAPPKAGQPSIRELLQQQEEYEKAHGGALPGGTPPASGSSTGTPPAPGGSTGTPPAPGGSTGAPARPQPAPASSD